MTTLLKIQASLFSHAGESSRLASQFVERFGAAHPGTQLIVRDLAAEPVPHLTAERFQSFLAKLGERSAEQHAVAAFSDALIDELERADVIVLGLPMYNFGVPSTLKAYFDHVARAGKTFTYTATGPQGLLKGKRAIVFATRGGAYEGTPLDTQTGYVRDFLRFLGIDHVEFVYAERLAMGDVAKTESIAKAAAGVDALVSRLASEVALAA